MINVHKVTTTGLNPAFDSDFDQKVNFQEFLNFTEPIIIKWVDIFNNKKVE